MDNTNITADALKEYLSGNASIVVLEADFVSDLPGEYLSKLVTNPNNVHDLAEVQTFTRTFKPEDYPERDTDLWNASLALGFNNTSPQFWPYYQRNLQIAGPEGITGLLKNYSLDAL